MRPDHEIGSVPTRRLSAERAAGPSARRWSDQFPLLQMVDEDGDLLAEEGEVTLADAEVLKLYRFMVLMRAVDERMITLQRQGRIGFYIGSIGEEATVFGSVAGMAEKDWIFPCYREHGAALFRGMSLVNYMCGLFRNGGDPEKGRQMPCHESYRAGNYASISSPIATQIPHAVGAAIAARLKGDDMVALAYFGDGATSSGEFHSAVNFAAVRKAPVIFLCRNNGWAISTPRERQTGAETFAQKAVGYGILGERVDGNDLLAVHAAVERARERAADGEGPTLLECVTYRLEGHSTSDDPRVYRPADQVEPWKRKDPILRMRRYLGRRGALDESGDEQLRNEVREQIQRALMEAEAFPEKPPVATLFEDVYREPLPSHISQREELESAIAADPRVANPRHSGS